MNGPSPNFDTREDSAEENNPVWALLSQAPLAQPDGWFAARTLARCRNEASGAPSRGVVLDRVWRWALGAGLAVCSATLVVTHTHPVPVASTSQKGVQEAFEIMATMAPDSDSPPSADNASWQD